jgi:hypothetical protein
MAKLITLAELPPELRAKYEDPTWTEGRAVVWVKAHAPRYGPLVYTVRLTGDVGERWTYHGGDWHYQVLHF